MESALPKKPGIAREIIAGITTFSAMAYILFVNPNILSNPGFPHETIFIATCVTAGIGCLLLGWLADYPIAMAPGMALNTYFALVLIDKLGYSWQLALTASFLAGLIFLIIVLFGLTKYIIKAIPNCLHDGILIGLGFLLILLALKDTGFWNFTMGSMHWQAAKPQIILFVLAGFSVIFALDFFKISGAIFIGILLTALLGFVFLNATFYGFVSPPKNVGFFLSQFDFKNLENMQGVSVVFSLFLVLFFDCAGTFVGLLKQANLPIEHKSLSRALFSTSFVSTLGGLMGTSGISAYAESAAGINAGGRTGITAITVGGLFLLALFFSPLARSIPNYAVAPALSYVGFLMVKNLRALDFSNMVFCISSLLTAIVIPCTFSVANGVAAGVLSYLLLALVFKKRQLINLPLVILACVFIGFIAIQYHT